MGKRTRRLGKRKQKRSSKRRPTYGRRKSGGSGIYDLNNNTRLTTELPNARVHYINTTTTMPYGTKDTYGTNNTYLRSNIITKKFCIDHVDDIKKAISGYDLNNKISKSKWMDVLNKISSLQNKTLVENVTPEQFSFILDILLDNNNLQLFLINNGDNIVNIINSTSTSGPTNVFEPLLSNQENFTIYLSVGLIIAAVATGVIILYLKNPEPQNSSLE